MVMNARTKKRGKGHGCAVFNRAVEAGLPGKVGCVSKNFRLLRTQPCGLLREVTSEQRHTVTVQN